MSLRELFGWFDILFQIAGIAFCTLAISLTIRFVVQELMMAQSATKKSTVPGKAFWLWYCVALAAVAAAVYWL